MIRKLLVAIAMIAGLIAGPALAETTPIALNDGQDWKHPETGLVIPASVTGFTRTSGGDFGNSGSDIFFQYYDQSKTTHVTLYYYRAGLPSVAIWADRIEVAMLSSSESYGTFDRTGRLWTTFTPTTGGADSAIRFVYPVSGKDPRATGAAIEQRGDWLVAVRITSSKLSAMELDGVLAGFMKGLGYSPSGTTPGAAYAIRACGDALPSLSAHKVKDFSLDEADTPMIEAALANITKPLSYDRFCREAGAGGTPYSVYRAGGSKAAYTIAFGDAGVVLQVAPWPIGASGQQAARYGLTLVTNDALVGYLGFDGLPDPEQAIKALDDDPTFGKYRAAGADTKLQLLGSGK